MRTQAGSPRRPAFPLWRHGTTSLLWAGPRARL